MKAILIGSGIAVVLNCLPVMLSIFRFFFFFHLWASLVSQLLNGKVPTFQCRRCRFDPWVRKIPWRRKWQPTPVSLPGKSQGQRSLEGYSPWGRRRVRHNWATKQQQHMPSVSHLWCFCYIAKSCQTLLWPHGPRCRLRCFWFCSSCGYSIVPVTFIENTIFVSINDIGTLSRSIGRKFWVYFWTPQPDSLICISIFFTYIDQDHMVLIT